MRLLRARALATVAVVTGWYAVGGPRTVAKRLVIAAIDAVIGKPVPSVPPVSTSNLWFNRERSTRQR